MNLRELKDLISDNESERLEFKRSTGQRTEAARTVCSTKIIERWGSGTLNIIDWCAENGNPAPAWSEQSGSVYVTFRPAVLPDAHPVTAQVPDKYSISSGEDGTKSALSRNRVEAQEAQVDLTSLEMSLLELCKNVPKTGRELITASGYASRTGNLKRSLEKLKSRGLIEMAIPDKPRSSKQKYRLTESGQKLLVQMKRRKK